MNMTNHIMKVRGRDGTKSLDLTLPAEFRKKYDIKPGDLFKVHIENKDELKIIYTLIYKN